MELSWVVDGGQSDAPRSASDIATDAVGNVVIAEGNHPIVPIPAVHKYSSAGTEVWTRSYECLGVNGLAIDATGNIILTGSFSSQNLDFGNGPLASSSSVSAFLAKLGP